MATLASFWKPKTSGQTVLQDRSIWIGQKLVEKAKSEKFKCDILSHFQAMWILPICSPWPFEELFYTKRSPVIFHMSEDEHG